MPMNAGRFLANSGWWRLLGRYAQFCLVGGSGVIVDMAVIWLLADPSMFGWNLTLSKTIAAEVALINNFVWNELWTFRELAAARTGWNQRLARFFKFNLICVAGIAWSVLLLNVQVYGLQVNLYLANLVSIILVSLWNFFMNLRFGWNKVVGQLPGSAEPVHPPRAKLGGPPPVSSQAWKRVLLGLVLVKAVYLGGVLVSVLLWPDMDEDMFHLVMQQWPREGGPVFASHFATYDGAHYLYLSEVGYAEGVPSCAFYPLWPLTIAGFSIFTSGSHLISGMFLANVFSLAAWVIFYQIAAKRFGESVALWALVFLILFPGSLFYQFIYSEPLFFLLVMLLWFGLERNRLELAWVGASLLPLSRPVGIFCLLPIAWHLLMKRPPARMYQFRWVQSERKRIASGETNAPERSINTNLKLSEYALLLAPLMGWGAYFAFMWSSTGNPIEGFQAQRNWNAHSISNLVDVPKFVIGLFTPTEFHAFRGSVLDRCAFILLVYCLPVIWRLGKDLLIWTYVLGILPAMSGTFTSFTRFESTAFPIFIALAVFFVGMKRRWPLIAFIIVSAALHLILLWRFVNSRWAG